MTFFELRTPRDMLEKAKREYNRLRQQFNIDNVFNFFVTAYHIHDYVLKTNAVPQVDLEQFAKDQDIRDCRDLCDKGKHLRLDKRADPSTIIWNGTIGGAPIGALPIGGGDKWVLFSGNREVDIEWLAERVLSKWESFFSAHGL